MFLSPRPQTWVRMWTCDVKNQIWKYKTKSYQMFLRHHMKDWMIILFIQTNCFLEFRLLFGKYITLKVRGHHEPRCYQCVSITRHHYFMVIVSIGISFTRLQVLFPCFQTVKFGLRWKRLQIHRETENLNVDLKELIGCTFQSHDLVTTINELEIKTCVCRRAEVHSPFLRC